MINNFVFFTHEVIEADEKTSYLVSMPNKFRKNVWIKRGDYCIVEPIEEGDKVKAEIVRILYKVRMPIFYDFLLGLSYLHMLLVGCPNGCKIGQDLVCSFLNL